MSKIEVPLVAVMVGLVRRNILLKSEFAFCCSLRSICTFVCLFVPKVPKSCFGIAKLIGGGLTPQTGP